MSKRPLIQVEDFDELFGMEDSSAGTSGLFGESSDDSSSDINDKKKRYSVEEIPLDQMHAFKNHPFHVKEDEKMADLVESIKTNGLLHPGLVRKDLDGGYEIISGHRRHFACGKAGLSTMPVRVLNLDDDAAVICMADANFAQRDSMLPSEKAKAYRMKFDAMRHQGSEGGGKTSDLIGKKSGESGRTVERYIKLSNLNDELLSMVDENKLNFVCAVDVASFDPETQMIFCEVLKQSGVSVKKPQIRLMVDDYNQGTLDKFRMLSILMDHVPAKRKYVVKEEFLNRYFPSDMEDNEIQKILEQAMELYRQEKERGGTESC